MLEENDLQRSQKSQNGISGTASAVFSSTDNSDDVRAPIASVEGVLVNQTFRETYRNYIFYGFFDAIFRKPGSTPASDFRAAST